MLRLHVSFCCDRDLTSGITCFQYSHYEGLALSSGFFSSILFPIILFGGYKRMHLLDTNFNGPSTLNTPVSRAGELSR